GVGKTRLIEEVLAACGDDAGTVLIGTCVPYGEANRWWPIASALAPVLGVDLAVSEDLQAPLDARLTELLGASLHPEHRAGIVNGLRPLFGQASPHDEIDPARGHQELVRAVLAVLAALAARGPLTLVVADLHWANLKVLELLEATLARLASTPFALIAT